MWAIKNPRTRVRLPVAAFTTLCGVATAAGGLLTWVSAGGARPRLGIDHTSFSKMLVNSVANGSPFWTSAGFAVLVLGVLMVIGALAGLRTLTVLAAVLALAAAGMWIGLIMHHYNTPSLPNVHYANPANLPWSDLREGAWLTISGALLGVVSAFWLSRRIRESARGAVAAGRAGWISRRAAAEPPTATRASSAHSGAAVRQAAANPDPARATQEGTT